MFFQKNKKFNNFFLKNLLILTLSDSIVFILFRIFQSIFFFRVTMAEIFNFSRSFFFLSFVFPYELEFSVIFDQYWATELINLIDIHSFWLAKCARWGTREPEHKVLRIFRRNHIRSKTWFGLGEIKNQV